MVFSFSFRQLGLATTIATISFARFAHALTGTNYVLQTQYAGPTFFDDWDFFTAGDPTQGFVTYVDRPTANKTGLIGFNIDGSAYIGVDHTNTYTAGGAGRPSVRISTMETYTHGLFLGDFSHMPGGICGTWPAFWTIGPNWPYTGEIDILEGVSVNTQNLMSLHTNATCSIAGDSTTETGALQASDCAYDPATGANSQGCGVLDSRTDSFGEMFNSMGGGVFAMQWTSDYIKIWFFPRTQIPANINDEQPDPSTWGLPAGYLVGDCNIDQHFVDHVITFDNTFCGSYAGSVWGTSTCPTSTGQANCVDYVAENPFAFTNSYWSINSVRVYQLQANTTTTTSSMVMSFTSSTIVSTSQSVSSSNSAITSSASSSSPSVTSTMSSSSTEAVHYNNTAESSVSLSSGTPQSSVLGPGMGATGTTSSGQSSSGISSVSSAYSSTSVTMSSSLSSTSSVSSVIVAHGSDESSMSLISATVSTSSTTSSLADPATSDPATSYVTYTSTVILSSSSSSSASTTSTTSTVSDSIAISQGGTRTLQSSLTASSSTSNNIIPAASSSSSSGISAPTTESASLTESSTTSTASVSPTTDPARVGNFAYAGCVGSNTGYAGFQVIDDSSAMSVELCTTECASFAYAGVYDTYCLCSNANPTIQDQQEGACDIPCPGDPTTACGGNVVVQNINSLLRRQINLNTILLTLYENIFLVVDAVPSSITPSLGGTTSAPTAIGSISTAATTVLTTVYVDVCACEASTLTTLTTTLTTSLCGCTDDITATIPMTTIEKLCGSCGAQGSPGTVTVTVPCTEAIIAAAATGGFASQVAAAAQTGLAAGNVSAADYVGSAAVRVGLGNASVALPGASGEEAAGHVVAASDAAASVLASNAAASVLATDTARAAASAAAVIGSPGLGTGDTSSDVRVAAPLAQETTSGCGRAVVASLGSLLGVVMLGLVV